VVDKMQEKKESTLSIYEHKKYNTIIFLISIPLTTRDVNRFGFEILKKHGFYVKIYDFSDLINRKVLFKNSVVSEATNYHICKINSYKSLTEELEKDVSHSIFVDMIVGLSEFSLSNEEIFRIFKRYGIKYCIVSAGNLPPMLPPDSFKYWSNRLKSALNPRLLSNFLAANITSFLRMHSSIYPLPEIIFSADSEVKSYYIKKYKIQQNKIIPINSFDYDIYLQYLNQNNSKYLSDYEYCVFLDEAATHHPDFDIMGIKHIDENRYYSSMNKLFDIIEKEAGFKVIIAAHPRSKYEQTPDVFGKREIIKGKTIELVANSSLVVAHSSTSINFAVLFNKPILIVKTSDLQKRGNLDFTDTMASALGLKSINVDEDSLNNISFRPDSGLDTKYEDYIYKYVKSRNAGDFFTWEIVARAIEKK
jgi:hypothetical protein